MFIQLLLIFSKVFNVTEYFKTNTQFPLSCCKGRVMLIIKQWIFFSFVCNDMINNITHGYFLTIPCVSHFTSIHQILQKKKKKYGEGQNISIMPHDQKLCLHFNISWS